MATNAEKEQRIRARAYEIWLEEGRPDGRENDHWRRAEAQISTEDAEQADKGLQPPLAGPYDNIS